MTVRVVQLKLTPDEALLPLEKLAAKALRLPESKILSAKTVKKSVDARNKSDIRLLVTLDAELKSGVPLPKGFSLAPKAEEWTETPADCPPPHPPVVVGLGPAGLFCALTLAMRGLNPIVLERGKSVEDRHKDVEAFFSDGRLDPASNVLFGEGGAGTFSDGKLTTGIKDPRIAHVLSTLYRFGAPEEILYEAKPHVGTDRLTKAVRGIRREIIRLGGDVRFETRLTGLVIENGRLAGVTTDKGDIETGAVFLCLGHSARDSFEMLYRLGVPMARKPFSIGARIEHPQVWLNRAQYGSFAAHPALGQADYKLSARCPDGRGVYTFCMCPGGQVIASASEEGGVVTNGMSVFARDGVNCNAALLTDVRPEDFPESAGVLAGMEFQRFWERAAYEAGGGSYTAPCQRVGDLLSGRPSKSAGDVLPSYRPGVNWTDLKLCLPEYAVNNLKFGITEFDRRIKGFAAPGACVTGVETRSSSPVRILRDQLTLQSAISGVYPVGEGAGYAGGITSAAVDGIRSAQEYPKK
ncbi:MAG: hypothetical protein IKY06_09345 [Clostridia bacterium]|nr:hypothetical protein [Clostridia bacterium]